MRGITDNRIASVLLALLATLGPVVLAAESVTVVSWGGSYAEVCEEAHVKPFAADTGIEVTLDD